MKIISNFTDAKTHLMTWPLRDRQGMVAAEVYIISKFDFLILRFCHSNVNVL